MLKNESKPKSVKFAKLDSEELSSNHSGSTSEVSKSKSFKSQPNYPAPIQKQINIHSILKDPIGNFLSRANSIKSSILEVSRFKPYIDQSHNFLINFGPQSISKFDLVSGKRVTEILYPSNINLALYNEMYLSSNMKYLYGTHTLQMEPNAHSSSLNLSRNSSVSSKNEISSGTYSVAGGIYGIKGLYQKVDKISL